MSNESEILIKGTESFNATRERIRNYYIEGLLHFSNYEGADRTNRKIHTSISMNFFVILNVRFFL